MHAVCWQCIEVGGQCGHEGFTFTGTHLGNFAAVQGESTDHLYVEVTHTHDAAGSFSHNCKGFREYLINGFALSQSFSQYSGLRFEVCIIEGFKAFFQRIYLSDYFAHTAQFTIIAGAEYFF